MTDAAMDAARQRMIERLRQDLLGPGAEDEVLRDSPSETYMTGILFTQKNPQGSEEPEAALIVSDEDDEAPSRVPPDTFRPSSAGLSFAVRPHDGESALLLVDISAAAYDPQAREGEETDKPRYDWARRLLSAQVSIELPNDTDGTRDVPGIPSLGLWLRAKRRGDLYLVTLMLLNRTKMERSAPGLRDLGNLHQVGFTVEADPDFAAIVPRPEVATPQSDEDRASAALLYWDAPDYGTGHTCSLRREELPGGSTRLATDWMPTALVRSPAAKGDAAFFRNLVDVDGKGALGSQWLSEAPEDELCSALDGLCDCYEAWIDARRQEADALPEKEYQATARRHLWECEKALGRMRSGVALLRKGGPELLAFRLANRALWLQNEWKRSRKTDIRPLVWRPFQMAFVLLSLDSTGERGHEDRGLMDLLWFPTGGGKTEAYLLLTAWTIFLRRQRGGEEAEGVTVLMRYTLRLLTAQQFQRAAAMILASDLIRTGAHAVPGIAIPETLSQGAPISVGLWVGKATTPNKRSEVDKESSPAQIECCPVCGSTLEWRLNGRENRVHARCLDAECIAGEAHGPLPFWTVDEDIYDELPTLLLGTVDKFVQIVTKPETGRLFGLGDAGRLPPDLIIQDELHLISGPLGSMAGLFETAIDALCTRDGHRPKIIGSTATIRRAADQVRNLFDRDVMQFPPPGLDQSNSGFACIEDDSPGRLYLGISTAGRTGSYMYQAIAASLLQAAADPSLSEEEEDHYWTLVGYFNSLRELGSASVIMQDDVTHGIDLLKDRRSEDPRHLQPPTELTSRVKSDEIRDRLAELEAPRRSGEAADVVLASNMISVGLDVGRLGLMLVNGQPKSIAEYIQATSRVGRGSVPGLVVTLYNANKSRDRSRYETFPTWHGALYRDVEATGVTPFAPRARDKALHAPFVAMVRHLVPGMSGKPSDAEDHEAEMAAMIGQICVRIDSIDPDEAPDARKELEAFLRDWLRRSPLAKYWDNWSDKALLISADQQATSAAMGFTPGLARSTPGTLRSVEPSTNFVIKELTAEQSGGEQ